MNQNRIVHSGVKGQKWYERRYQNYDGSLTPEGREHYGVGPARVKVTGNAENTHKKPDKPEKETGYEKIVRKAKEFKESKLYKEAKEGFAAAKKEASEKAAKIYADAKKRAQEAKELKEKQKQEEEKEEKERRTMGDRSDKWKEYEDNELQAYTTRKKLEDAANDAQFSAKIQKADRLRQVVAEANNYLTTGLSIYQNYKKLQVEFSPASQTPTNTKSSDLAKEVLDLMGDMSIKDFDNKVVKQYNEIIKTVQSLEDASKNKRTENKSK